MEGDVWIAYLLFTFESSSSLSSSSTTAGGAEGVYYQINHFFIHIFPFLHRRLKVTSLHAINTYNIGTILYKQIT